MNLGLEKKLRIPFPMGILGIDFHEESKTLFAACMDGIYRVSVASVSESSGPKPAPEKIGAHPSYVSSVALSRLRSQIATTSYDGTLQIRPLVAAVDQENPGLNTPIMEKKIHGFWSWDMAMSPDEKYIVSVTGQYLAGSEDYKPLASDEPTVRVIDASTGDVLHGLHMLPSVQCVAIDPTSKYVAAGNLIGDLAVWDLSTGKVLSQWNTPSFSSWGIIKSHCYIGGIYAVSFSPDGQFLYAAGMGDMRDPMAGNGKQLWEKFDWRKSPAEKVSQTKGDQSGEGLMETLVWHPSGEYFAMAGRLRGGNWNVGLFSATSGDLIGSAKTGMRITSAQFSKDGRHLYLAGMQGQPGPKDGKFPDFGYLECYEIQSKT